GEDGAPPAWRRPSISARARRFRWLYQAPFGMPVVPLVKTIATGSSAAGGTADVGRAPPARSATVFAVPTRSRSAESQTNPAGRRGAVGIGAPLAPVAERLGCGRLARRVAQEVGDGGGAHDDPSMPRFPRLAKGARSGAGGRRESHGRAAAPRVHRDRPRRS